METAATSTAAVFHAIYQSGAHNFVTGTVGADSLSSASGAILEGGAGNDTLTGAAEADVYIYRNGDGNDRIADYSTWSNTTDRLVFSDLAADDVTFSHNSGGDLVISTAGGETITVIDHFANWVESIEEISFADGTVMDLADIQQRVDDDAFLF